MCNSNHHMNHWISPTTSCRSGYDKAGEKLFSRWREKVGSEELGHLPNVVDQWLDFAKSNFSEEILSKMLAPQKRVTGGPVTCRHFTDRCSDYDENILGFQHTSGKRDFVRRKIAMNVCAGTQRKFPTPIFFLWPIASGFCPNKSDKSTRRISLTSPVASSGAEKDEESFVEAWIERSLQLHWQSFEAKKHQKSRQKT